MSPRSTRETNDDTDAKVVKPYAIEEPDDEPTSKSHRSVVSCLPDSFERWQVDLIESMDDLQCKSDDNDTTLRRGHRRGQKRKPTATASGTCPSIQQSSPPGTKCREAQYEGQGLSRNRPRKRSKRPNEDGKSENDSSSFTSSGSASYMSLSSAPQSTEASGAETDNMSSDPMADKMDMD